MVAPAQHTQTDLVGSITTTFVQDMASFVHREVLLGLLAMLALALLGLLLLLLGAFLLYRLWYLRTVVIMRMAWHVTLSRLQLLKNTSIHNRFW
jgi:hypothetical protein